MAGDKPKRSGVIAGNDKAYLLTFLIVAACSSVDDVAGCAAYKLCLDKHPPAECLHD